MRSVLVEVPASAANLGPGFDCLAMALSLTNSFEFSLAEAGTHISYLGPLSEQFPLDEKNLAVASFAQLAEHAGVERPGLKLQARVEVPPSSGLGSSSTAVVAGLLAANQLLDLGYDRAELLALAASIEGHADNSAAALYGGLVGVHRVGQGWDVLSLPLAPLKLVIVVPEVESSTRQMRAILPSSLTRDQAVTYAAGTLAMQQALAAADFKRMRRASLDSFHQDVRLPQIPGAQQAVAAAQTEGAAVVLAGAGPGLMAMAPDNHDRIAAAMQSAFQQKGIATKRFICSSRSQGALIRPAD